MYTQTMRKNNPNLTMTIKHLSVRLRAVMKENPHLINMTHTSILFRLHTLGPMTITDLATTENVSQQAMSQQVAIMKDAGWIESMRDETDGRRTFIRITKKGEARRKSFIQYCDDWVSQTADNIFSEEERETLRKSVVLLEQLANA